MTFDWLGPLTGAIALVGFFGSFSNLPAQLPPTQATQVTTDTAQLETVLSHRGSGRIDAEA
jgi:hypothetical protein